MLSRDLLLEGSPAFVHSTRVRFADSVGGGRLFHPKMLELFHDAYEALLAANDVPLDRVLRERTWGAPLVHAELELLGELPTFGTELEILMPAAAIRKNRVTFGYRVRDAGSGDVVAIGSTVHAFVDLATFQKIDTPEKIVALLGRFPAGAVTQE